MTIANDTNVFEVEFQEAGNPRGPDYRWFSSIGKALEFMHGITSEMHVEEMTFRNHAIEHTPGGFAAFLNKLSSRELTTLDDEIPF
jgi:hypothetical protein